MAAPLSKTESTIMIQEPPYCLLDADINVDTEDALVEAKKGLLMLPSLKSLHEVLLKENRLIKTIVHTRHAQLRGQKQMQLLKRVKACLQRIHLMDRMFTIAADVLKDIKISLKGEIGHLPCKQSWTFLLYLISQYHELLNQTVSYCLTTFQYLSNLVTVKQLLHVFVIFMGICARVWQVCRTLSDKLASVYSHLYSVQQCLKASSTDWVYPDLPTTLVESSNLSLLDNERICGDSLTDPEIFSSRTRDCASAIADVSGFVQGHSHPESDSEEDIGVAISMEECQRVIKRKAESSALDSSLDTARSKNEGNKPKKRKKMKDIKSVKAPDFVAHSDGTLQEKVLCRNIAQNKKQKKKKRKMRKVE